MSLKLMSHQREISDLVHLIDRKIITAVLEYGYGLGRTPKGTYFSIFLMRCTEVL